MPAWTEISIGYKMCIRDRKVTVVGQDKDSSGNIWYKIKTASGKIGYIRSDLLKADSSNSSDTKSDSNNSNSGTESDLNGQKMQVKYDGVNMRSGAGTSKGCLLYTSRCV